VQAFLDAMKKNFFGFRWPYFLGFMALLGIEVLIALFVHDGFIRPHLGDVLVICVLYCLVRAFVAYPIRGLPLYLFLLGTAVETGQYFQLATRLGLDGNIFFRTILGATFDPADILCYFAGSAVLLLWELIERKYLRRPQ